MNTTLFRHTGGKQKHMFKLIPNILECREYRDCMTGGGSFITTVKKYFPNAIYWMNDKNPVIFHLFSVTQKEPDRLCKYIEKIKGKMTTVASAKLFFERADRIISDFQEYDPFEIAIAYYVNKHLAFSSLDRGCFSEGQYFRFIKSDRHLKNIEVVGELLKGVKITNDDYSIPLLQPGKDVFCFLDPPYYNCDQQCYGSRGQYSFCFDHRRFYNNVCSANHKLLITYDEYLRSPYGESKFIVEDFTTTYGMYASIGYQIMIRNYRLKRDLEIKAA